MDLKGTVIIYNEEVNKTTIQTNNPKDIKKVKSKFPKEYIEELKDNKGNIKEIVMTVTGRHMIIPGYTTEATRQARINNLKNQ
ncbi:MAG TPA: hypothetical protein K8V90_05185 [Romboutsia timonensis]|uniref:Uncharacterized protein n=1 Tax=Romboutsia timonensis TaxID=1776391 RepID=A0A921N0H6_9FIRM|nr:hypothetical protein [Romboutsia timonensis]